MRGVGLRYKYWENLFMIDVDKLSVKKQDAIASLLYPTKRENAERMPEYFYSTVNSAWFLFRPSVPVKVQNEIISILKSKLGV